ncbi:MAG: DUF5615 family PIN-like protein [Verrucomicrobia bacterium]|nr:DUF5615 family PIN-like protein [Verrucomicrobiota bacterium]
MARFYSNENFPLRAVQSLRALGHDVLTSLEADRANQKIPDTEVLRFATEEGRAVLTLNRLDFFRLHRETEAHHAGIIACTQNRDSAALAERIHQAVEADPDLNGKLIRIVR